jgi:hypothetical protein
MRSKNPERPLAVIANEIRARQAETIDDIIAIGGLLFEAKDQLDHGQWLPWVQQEFGYSARTAQNYMRAHKFAGKYENVVDLKLASTALYRLADTGRRRRSSLYTAEAIVAILAEAKDKRVGPTRADEIARSRRHESDAKLAYEDASAPGQRPGSGPAPAPIPPTPRLQPAPLPRDASVCEKFAAALVELEILVNKPCGKFVGLIAADRLEMVANFLKQVAATSRRPA